MVVIDKEAPLVTVIVRFLLAPEHQERLLDLTETLMAPLIRRQPGFISSSFHRSPDGTQVVNYAQWRSLADYEAFQREPAVQESVGHVRDFMREAAVRTESQVFEIAFSIEPTAS
jgi:tetracenomycin F1 monooxygenase